MKNRIITMMILICFSCIGMYGETYRLSDLVSKTWYGVSGYTGSESIDVTIEFTDNSLIFKAWPKNEINDITTFVYHMCMSDSLPENGCFSIPQRQSSGKYFTLERTYVYKGVVKEERIVCEILSLSETALTLKSGKATMLFETR